MSKKPLSQEAKALTEEIRFIQEDVNYKKLIIRGGDAVTYDFSNYKTFNELFRDLYYEKMTINDAKMKQNEFDAKFNTSSRYSPRNPIYTEAKNSLLNNVKNFYKGRKKIIEGFKDGTFLLKSDDESEQQQVSKKSTKDDVSAFNERINKEETAINSELFKKYFNFQRPSEMLKYLYQTNDREKNNKSVSVINSELQDLEKEIKEMSEEERENEKPQKIVKIVEKILKFNKQKQNQEGCG